MVLTILVIDCLLVHLIDSVLDLVLGQQSRRSACRLRKREETESEDGERRGRDQGETEGSRGGLRGLSQLLH